MDILLKYHNALQRNIHFPLRDIAFEKQLNFIVDPSKLKALFCTRRAAKSFTAGIYLIKEAIENPRGNFLFVALTRDSARGIIWKDILKEIDRAMNLGIRFNESALTATLPNGSVIWVTGADADESEMNKLLGRKYKLCCIDEASMFTIDMHKLVYGILKPATADQRGTICLFGTSSNITRGLFYDISTRAEQGWSLHEWSAFDNPHVAKQWQEELEEIKNLRPQFMQTALFQQWYLNKWVQDEDAKVYKFSKERNLAKDMPLWDSPYHYVLGVDLGFHPDPTAFVIGAYHPASPKLYLVHAEKQERMDITDVAQRIKVLEKMYPFDVKIVDNAAAQAVAELNNRHKCNLIAAEKHAKVDFINLMNTDFMQGHILCLPGTEELQEEFNCLVWITDNGKVKEPKKEHPTLPNHLCDASLYLWRHCHQYLFHPPAPPVRWDAQERWEPEHMKKLADQIQKEQNPNHWDHQFEPEKDLFDFDLDNPL